LPARRPAEGLSTGDDVPFEVLCRTDGRWLTDRILADMDSAIAYARQRLGSGEVEAARVIEEKSGLLVGSRERVVFEETGTVRAKKPVTAASVDSSPVCDSLVDVFSFPARQTIGRVLRAYLDQEGLCPAELMASVDHLKQLVRRDDLLNQAIGIIAAVQARGSAANPRERAAMLYELLGEVNAFLGATPAIAALGVATAQGDMAGLEAHMAGAMEPARKRIVALCAVARSLAEAADPIGKIGLLLDRLDSLPAGSPVASIIDEILSDILDDAGAVREVLGRRGDLADAMGVVVQVLTNRRGSVRGDDPVLARLERALSGPRDLAQARRCLQAWLEKALRSIQPLTREGRPQERKAFLTLLERMALPAGLMGGPSLSEAMVLRARSALIGEEEEQKLETAMARLLRGMETPACQLGFIMDMLETPTGRKAAGALMRQMVAILRDVPDLAGLTDLPPDRVEALRADLRQRIERSALPVEIRAAVQQRLAKLKQHAPDAAGVPAAESGTPASTASALRSPAPASAAAPAAPVDPDRVELAAGQTVFSPGDAASCAYRVVSGRIGLSRVVNGSEIPLDTIMAGAVFGDTALAGAATRTEKARALQPTILQRIPSERFSAALAALGASDPGVAAVIQAHRDRLAALAKRGVAV